MSSEITDKDVSKVYFHFLTIVLLTFLLNWLYVFRSSNIWTSTVTARLPSMSSMNGGRTRKTRFSLSCTSNKISKKTSLRPKKLFKRQLKIVFLKQKPCQSLKLPWKLAIPQAKLSLKLSCQLTFNLSCFPRACALPLVSTRTSHQLSWNLKSQRIKQKPKKS